MLFFIILILTYASGFFLPWWMAAVIAFLAAFLIGKTSKQSFWSGFGSVFIVWIVLALIKSIPNNQILVKRVAGMFQLPNWLLILLLTAIIGGLVGGLSAWSGMLMKKAVKG